MAHSLVDKNEDADESDSGLARRRRRARLMIAVGVLLVVALIAGLLIAHPWSGNDAGGAQRAPSTSPPVSSAGSAEVTLPNRLVLGEVGEGFTVQWVNDGEANAGRGGQPTGKRSVAMLAKPGAGSEGPWLMAGVDLLDRFDRKSFDPANYLGDPSGRKVTIGDVKGYFIETWWTGSSLLVFGPVQDGYAVSFNSAGLSEAELVAVAGELALDEADDQPSAAPVFGAKAAELGLEPIVAFEQDAWGFGGGAVISVTGGQSPLSTSVNYFSQSGDNVSVNNEPLTPGLDPLAVAKVMFDDAEEVTVHDLPAVKGSDQFTGGAVVWVEGGRMVSVAGNVDDLLAAAESVEVADESTWKDLIQQSQANNGDPGALVTESWLIGAGDLEDSTTWLIDGGLDDEGRLVLCSAAFSNNGGSMQGCGGDPHDVTRAGLFNAGSVSMDGSAAAGLVATVPLDVVGAVLRFTDGDGAVSETPLKVIRGEWTFLAAATAVTVSGTATVVAADGTELATLAVTDESLGAGIGVGGSVTAATVAGSGG